MKELNGPIGIIFCVLVHSLRAFASQQLKPQMKNFFS